jgi:hypothetical protein
VRRFLDARAERAAGRARDTVLLSKRIGVVFAQRTWRGLLAQRAPPLKAARSGAAWAEGCRGRAATRSLRSAREAAHSEGAAGIAALAEHPSSIGPGKVVPKSTQRVPHKFVRELE